MYEMNEFISMSRKMVKLYIRTFNRKLLAFPLNSILLFIFTVMIERIGISIVSIFSRFICVFSVDIKSSIFCGSM